MKNIYGNFRCECGSYDVEQVSHIAETDGAMPFPDPYEIGIVCNSCGRYYPVAVVDIKNRYIDIQQPRGKV